MSNIYCGFFNSINGDRLYTAEDMVKPYELLVSNGVFATPEGTPSDYLQVFASSGMNVIVKAGRGIFQNKWFILDGDMALTVQSAEVTLPRVDTVVVRIDSSEAVRSASILIKKGVPASEPLAPTLESNTFVQEYRLANIMVEPGVTSIRQLNIRDTRMTKDCGWVTSLVQQVDTETLYIQFEDAFNAWFSNVKETLATSTLIRSYNSHYTTLVQDETVIPIGITQFNVNLDILDVYINGLKLIKDVEYTSDNNDTITLTNGVDVGTIISFEVYKSIDGSEAETVVQQVYELQTLVDASRATSENGGVKVSVGDGASALDAFTSLGTGLHTFYASNSAIDTPVENVAFRFIGHITATVPNYQGWLMAFSTNGSMWINYITSGVWRGWRMIYEATAVNLITTDIGYYPSENARVVPSKPLDQCRTGWVLVWCGYEPSTRTPQDEYVQTVLIPKKSHKGVNWDGESMTFSLVGSTDGTTISQVVKTLNVYNDYLLSAVAYNSSGDNRNLVLRAVYEY